MKKELVENFDKIKFALRKTPPREVCAQTGIDWRSIMRYRQGNCIPRTQTLEKLMKWFSEIQK
jgi:hypothetical protein